MKLGMGRCWGRWWSRRPPLSLTEWMGRRGGGGAEVPLETEAMPCLWRMLKSAVAKKESG